MRQDCARCCKIVDYILKKFIYIQLIVQIRLYRRRHLLALSYRLLYRKKISISYGGRLEIQYTKKKTFENERNMIRYLKRAFVNCPARDTSKYYIRSLPPRIPILWPKVTTRWRRHESLKIIFYQYAESDGTGCITNSGHGGVASSVSA